MFSPSTLVTLGIIVLITPFLGLPTPWKTGIFIISGLLVIAGGYSYRKIGNETKKETPNLDQAFIENGQSFNDKAGN